jgi:predicted esterase
MGRRYHVLHVRPLFVALFFTALVSCRSAPPRATLDDGSATISPPIQSAAPPSRDAGMPDVATDWCLPPWRGIDEGVCYFVPEKALPKLLVYLPGIVPPWPARSPQKEKVEAIVAQAAARAGIVAMLPRGRRGIGPADAKHWWAWPTSPRDHAALAASIIAEWRRARSMLEGVVGPFEKTWFAGSSSGAYFLTNLALEGAFDADGWGAMSGGAPSTKTGGLMKPFYVGYGSADPANGGPRALAAWLTAHGWPIRVAEHAGGHGAREIYLDEAIAFWNE